MNHLRKTVLRHGLLLVAVTGSASGWADQPIDPPFCGMQVGPGGSWVLTANVKPPCNGAPVALTVTGPVRLDMNGYMVLCEANGVGVPTGIQVAGQNARISGGTVKGCATGIAVEGDGHHKLDGITVVDSQGKGIEIKSDANRLEQVTVVGSQDKGIEIESKDNRLEWVTVLGSAGEGMRIKGDNNWVIAGLAVGNHDHGIRVQKADHNRILYTRALSNRVNKVDDFGNPKIDGEGIRLEGDHNVAKHCIAIGNGDEGVRVKEGDGNVVSHCLVKANGTTTGEPGIEVGNDDNVPTHTTVVHNRAIANAADGIAIGGKDTLVRHNRTLANGSVLPSDTGPAPFGSGIRVRQVLDDNDQPVSLDNRLTHNTARGNRVTDLVDENDNCDNDVWRRNRFDTADPAGCVQ